MLANNVLNLSRDRCMRSFLINRNLSLYYWLKRKIGKRRAFWVANTIEKVILIFGRGKWGERRKWWLMNSIGVTKQRKSILLGYCQREGKIQKE
jgi:hypothetical protein